MYVDINMPVISVKHTSFCKSKDNPTFKIAKGKVRYKK